MECPEGMEHDSDEICLLLKTIYGLVQSARQFYKKWIAILQSIGFKQSLADPCLLIRKSELGLVLIGAYVDDNYTVGHEAAIKETIELIKKSGFNVTVEDELSDYLSCKIQFDKKKTKAWLGQPHLIKKLDKKFGDLVKGLQKYRTPGTPGQGIV